MEDSEVKKTFDDLETHFLIVRVGYDILISPLAQKQLSERLESLVNNPLKLKTYNWSYLTHIWSWEADADIYLQKLVDWYGE